MNPALLLTAVHLLWIPTLAVASDGPAVPESAPRPTLLYVVSGADMVDPERSEKYDQLTIEKFHESGVKVIERTEGDLADWLAGAGKPYQRAAEPMQYVAWARSVGADAVAGVYSSELSEEIAARLPDGIGPGVKINAWGYGLTSITEVRPLTVSADEPVRAIPVQFYQRDRAPWEVPTDIGTGTCEPPDVSELAAFARRRAFLGIRPKPTNVTIEQAVPGLIHRVLFKSGVPIAEVIPDSPAEAAGLRADDVLVEIGGTKLHGPSDLTRFLRDRKPGDELEVAWKRKGESHSKTVSLADRFTVVDAKKYELFGHRVPDLIARDIDGNEVGLGDLRGKVVLLEFWATWCGPCIRHTPLVQLTWERFKDNGLVWVGVSADDDQEAWRNFVRDNRLGGIQIRDQEWISAFHIDSYPTTILIDRNGVARCLTHGAGIAPHALGLLNEPIEGPPVPNVDE